MAIDQLEADAPRTMTPSDDRVDVHGVGFDPITESQVVDRVFDELAADRGGFLVTPNVDILRQLHRPALRELVDRASIVVADGMPVVWASRLAARPLPERVAGSSLVGSLASRAASDGRSIFLLGGDPGIAEAAAERLTDEHAGLDVAGWHFPPFGFETDERAGEQLRASLHAASPDIVFVGLGFPRQERLILSLQAQFPRTWFVACGGGLTMAAGVVSRAPGVLQRSGLEWAHRLVKEPRRLVRRYLVDDAPFATVLLARALVSRFRPTLAR